MSAPTVIQQWGPFNASVSNEVQTLTGITANSTLVVLITSTGSRTYTISDDVNGSWIQGIRNAPSRTAEAWYFAGSASGTVELTIDQSATLTAYRYTILEIDPSTLDATSSFVDAVNVTSHPCAASGAIDTASNVILFSGGVLSASSGAITKNASATLIDSSTSGTFVLWQYRASDTALTDEESIWTSATARLGTCISISFAAAGGGPNEGFGSVVGIGGLTGAGSTIRSGSGSIDSVGLLTGAGQSIRNGSGSVAGVGELDGVGFAPVLGPASGFGSVVGVGLLTGSGSTTRSGSGSIDAIGVLTGVGFAPITDEATGFGTVSGIGLLSGAGTTTRQGFGSITAIDSIIGSGSVVRSGSGAIDSVGLLTGAGPSSTSSSSMYYYLYLAQ